MHRGLGGAVQVEQTRRARVAVDPRPKTLWLKRFTGEYHRMQVQLTSELGLQRVRGLQRIEGRRRLGQDGDLFGSQQSMEFLRRAGHRFGHHHQPAAVQQRAPHLADRNVEGQGMPERPNLFGHINIGIHGGQQLGHVLVGDGNALGDAGGARGVDEVGDVVGRRPRQPGTRLARDGGIVHVDDAQVRTRQPLGQLEVGDRSRRRGIAEHQLHARRRRGRVDRHIRRPGLEHRQNRHDRLSRPRQQQRHPLPRPNPLAGPTSVRTGWWPRRARDMSRNARPT